MELTIRETGNSVVHKTAVTSYKSVSQKPNLPFVYFGCSFSLLTWTANN